MKRSERSLLDKSNLIPFACFSKALFIFIIFWEITGDSGYAREIFVAFMCEFNVDIDLLRFVKSCVV